MSALRIANPSLLAVSFLMVAMWGCHAVDPVPDAVSCTGVEFTKIGALNPCEFPSPCA